MTKINSNLMISLIFTLIVIGVVLAYDWPTFDINPELSEDAYDILVKYLFLIIVFERGVAVYTTVKYDGPKLKAQRKKKYYREKLDLYKQTDPSLREDWHDNDPGYLEISQSRPKDSPNINYMNLIEIQEHEIEENSENTRKFSVRTLMIVGILIAIGGLSILSDLIQISRLWYETSHVIQRSAIKFIDILLTGALIGGGSKSFHQLLSTIQSVFDQIKEARNK